MMAEDVLFPQSFVVLTKLHLLVKNIYLSQKRKDANKK